MQPCTCFSGNPRLVLIPISGIPGCRGIPWFAHPKPHVKYWGVSNPPETQIIQGNPVVPECICLHGSSRITDCGELHTRNWSVYTAVQGKRHPSQNMNFLINQSRGRCPYIAISWLFVEIKGRWSVHQEPTRFAQYHKRPRRTSRADSTYGHIKTPIKHQMLCALADIALNCTWLPWICNIYERSSSARWRIPYQPYLPTSSFLCRKDEKCLRFPT